MLALVGSGEYLPEVDIIDQTLISRLTAPVRVVCLPTAAGREGDAMIQSWMQKGVTHFNRLGVTVTGVPVIDAATAHSQTYADAVRQANFVYLSGGHPGYLADCLDGSPVWDAILGVHLQGGIVAGCSAGAMIMGERISGPGGNRNGFNLLPGTVIIPHFDEFPGIVTRVMRFFSGSSLTMLGIDGRTALVVDNGRYEVLGSGHVTVFNGSGHTAYHHGPIPTTALP